MVYPQFAFLKDGDVLDPTISATAVASGDVVDFAGCLGAYTDDVYANRQGVMWRGKIGYAVKDGSSFAVGDVVYWDSNGSPVTGTVLSGAATSTASSGDYLMGICLEAAAAGADRVKVMLKRQSRLLPIEFGALGSGGCVQGLLGGIGTVASPATAAAAQTDRNFLDFRLSSPAATGTTRGIYAKLFLTGGAGGEALRAFTECDSNAPVDTVNGAHISLQYGASAGNVSGLANAARCTLMAPNRALTGTVSAVMAEIWADGASSAITNARASFLRCALGGDTTGMAAIEDYANLLEIVTGSNASGNVVSGVGSEPTWSSATYKIRIVANGVTMYLVAVAA